MPMIQQYPCPVAVWWIVEADNLVGANLCSQIDFTFSIEADDAPMMGYCLSSFACRSCLWQALRQMPSTRVCTVLPPSLDSAHCFLQLSFLSAERFGCPGWPAATHPQPENQEGHLIHSASQRVQRPGMAGMGNTSGAGSFGQQGVAASACSDLGGQRSRRNACGLEQLCTWVAPLKPLSWLTSWLDPPFPLNHRKSRKHEPWERF